MSQNNPVTTTTSLHDMFQIKTLTIPFRLLRVDRIKRLFQLSELREKGENVLYFVYNIKPHTMLV